MPSPLSGKEILEKQGEYLIAEIAKHERDIATNQGKVQENKELLERIQNTCLYCAQYIYQYRDDNRMEAHVKEYHLESEDGLAVDSVIS